MGGEMGMPGVPGMNGENMLQGLGGLLLDLQSLTKQLATIHPGLAILGVATEQRARELALAEDLDMVLFIRIKVSPPKAGRQPNTQVPPQSTFQLKILDPIPEHEDIFISRPIDNIKVAQAMSSRSSDDPIAELVEKVTQSMDNVVLTDMPALTPELVAKRAEHLAATATENPLPSLMELRYYEWKGLIKPEQLSAAYTRLVGEDGAKLATGTEDERRKIVERWLPKLEEED